MYAVIRTGSKQYKVEKGSVLDVEKLEDSKGKVSLKDVLLVSGEGKLEIGKPTVKGAEVVCDVLGQVKGKKVTSFKFKRRKNYRKKKGHRQSLTRLMVKDIKLS